MVKSILAGLAIAGALIFSPIATADSSVAASGEFSGLSRHVTTGGVSILKTSTGYVLVLEQNFSLDGAPSPTIGFGKGGKFDGKTEFTKLKDKTGLQVYALPATINPADYDEIYIWCAKFSVPLGVAKLAS